MLQNIFSLFPHLLNFYIHTFFLKITLFAPKVANFHRLIAMMIYIWGEKQNMQHVTTAIVESPSKSNDLGALWRISQMPRLCFLTPHLFSKVTHQRIAVESLSFELGRLFGCFIKVHPNSCFCLVAPQLSFVRWFFAYCIKNNVKFYAINTISICSMSCLLLVFHK